MTEHLTDLARSVDMELSPIQQARLTASIAGPRKHTGWWVAPVGAHAPGPHRDGETLTAPWIGPWQQLNDPYDDRMTVVCLMDEQDPSHGYLIMIDPTEEAIRAHHNTRWSDNPHVSLGCETAIRVQPPDVDYRAVFRHVQALPSPGDTLRWRYTRPAAGVQAWDVITGGWLPDTEKARRLAELKEIDYRWEGSV
jgi:hypothetical protein